MNPDAGYARREPCIGVHVGHTDIDQPNWVSKDAASQRAHVIPSQRSTLARPEHMALVCRMADRHKRLQL